MGVVSEVTRMARGWLAVSNPGYESIISMILSPRIEYTIPRIEYPEDKMFGCSPSKTWEAAISSASVSPSTLSDHRLL